MLLFFVKFLFVIGLNGVVSGMLYKSNTTDLSQCNVSYSRSGSTYKDFYPIQTYDNQTLILDFHFAVLATSDAHILIAESENVSKNDPAYEIVIGAGGNTFCDIRRMQKSDVRQSVRMKGLLSALDPHFFWLHIRKEDEKSGIIEVGREGENSSFIDWLDPELLPVKVISFSTWSGIEAKWYFNCDRSQSEEEIEKRLTVLERLRRNLLRIYDPMVRPVVNQSVNIQVNMTLNLEYLDLDEYKSNIQIRGMTTLKWHDEKLIWNPQDYDNLTLFQVMRYEIWNPKILCFNAVDNPADVLEDAIVTIDNNGNVLWKPTINVKAVCEGSNIGHWPRDIHDCKILFGFSADTGNIEFNFNETDSSMLQQGSSQWLILEASVFDVEHSNLTSSDPIFGFYFEIRRSSTLYNIVFFTPFLVISSCLLLSFWTPPFGHTKLSLGCSELILEVIMLLALAYIVPGNTNGVPFLIFLYSGCLVGSLLSLLLAIIVINISTKPQSKPLHHMTCNILTNKLVKTALFLPSVSVPEDYGDLDISTSSTTLSRTDDKSQHFWVLLGIAIDRLSFLIYTPIILSLIIKCIVISC